MPLITDYTTYAEIRAVLGVNVDELPDATLGLAVYAHALNIELEQIGEALPEDFATIKAKAENDRTEAEKKVYQGVLTFAPYSIAVQLASSLPLFSPKQVTDGKAAVTRYADSPYRQTIERCLADYDRFKTYLKEKYAAYKSSSSSTAQRPFFSVSAPDSDPVTGT